MTTTSRGYTLGGLLTAAITGTMLAGTVQAQEFRYAIGYPPGSIGDEAAELYADAMEEYSDGNMSVNVYPLSLLNFEEAAGGVREGMADSALILLPYFTSMFPTSNMLAEVSMLLELEDADEWDAPIAYAGAMSEFIFHHCPECQEEFLEQNHVFTGGSASSPYYLLCSDEVTSIDDMDGKRLRVGGAQWARWVEAMGGSSVSMSVNEIYEGMSQGVVDCSVQSAPELSTFRLMEVSSDITVGMPGGVYAGSGVNNTNASTWQGLSEEDRETYLRATTVMSAQVTWLYSQEGVDNMEEAEALEDVNVHQPDDDFVEATHDFIRDDIEAIAEHYRDEYGVEDAEQMIEDFRGVLERWLELVADVEDADELAELYWEETVSDVDVSTYGQ